MHNGVDSSGGALHAQEHTHESAHAHLHTHTGEHAHQHEGLSPETVHTHEHTHTLSHEHACAPESGQAHRHDAEDCPNLEEVVALLAYTLQHNLHHDAELRQMQEQLRLLGLGDAAEQLGQSMADFAAGNARLAILLKTLQE